MYIYIFYVLFKKDYLYIKLKINPMADELIDIYDKNNKTLDIQLMKSEAHKK